MATQPQPQPPPSGSAPRPDPKDAADTLQRAAATLFSPPAPAGAPSAPPAGAPAATPAAAPAAPPVETPKVTVSPGGLQAHVELPPGFAGTTDLVLTVLKGAGVVYGIDEEALAAGLAKAKTAKAPHRFLVANAKAPVEAMDGTIEIKFKAPAKTEDEENDKKNVDFHETGKVIAVKENDVLAVFTPGVDGLPGSTVTGKDIFPKKRRAAIPRLTAGKNVRVENNVYIAASEGMVMYTGRDIQVSQEFLVPGDVDYSIGNIRFSGTVTVRGSVRPDFVIEAGGHITIYGEINDAKIVSGGNVIVYQGIVGTGKTEIKAKGNVNAGFIESSKVEAEGDIGVKNYVMHSRLFANGWVRATSGKGAIIGGETHATKGIEARFIGSETVRGTIVAIGGGLSLDNKLKELDAQLATLKTNMQKIRLAVGADHFDEMLTDMELVKKKVLQTKRPIILRLINEYQKMAPASKQLAEERDRVIAEIAAVQQGTIRATVNAFEGSLIHIGHLRLEVKQDLPKTEFIGDFTGGEIRLRF